MHFLVTLLLFWCTVGAVSAQTPSGAVCPYVVLSPDSLANSNDCSPPEKDMILAELSSFLNDVLDENGYPQLDWEDDDRRRLLRQGDRSLPSCGGGYYCCWGGCRRRRLQNNNDDEEEDGGLQSSLTSVCELALSVIQPQLNTPKCKEFVLSAACTVSV